MRNLNTATRRVLAALLCAGSLAAGDALAAPVGNVVNVSGPLFSVKTDGTRQVLGVGSGVEQGDTLVTEGKTYARVKFTDQGEITLRPGTQLKVESYAFAQAEPAKDNVVFGLLKGTLRSLTGLIGKRGNQDAFKMQTATATIGIRGTNFVAEFVPGKDTDVAIYGPQRQLAMLSARSQPLALANTPVTDAPTGVLPALLADPQPLQLAQNQSKPETAPASCKKTAEDGSCEDELAPGLYVHVLDGMINLTNRAGSQLFAAGQFGYTPSFNQLPIILPTNPGIQFMPPPTFTPTTPTPGATAPPANQQEGCVVR